MIQQAKYQQALYALHQLLTRARFMAGTESDCQGVVTLLDYAEMLPRLIASEEDKTEEFRAYLEDIVTRFRGCRYILDSFDEPAAPERW